MHKPITRGNLDAAEFAKALQDNPALRLFDFFQERGKNLGDDSSEPIGLPRLLLVAALEVSASLNRLTSESLGDRDVSNWVRYWQSTGYLPKL